MTVEGAGRAARARPLRRAFVAVVPSREAIDAVDAAVAPLREEPGSLRWMPREQWHVTLQFLGRVADVGELSAALREAAASVAPFSSALGGGGAFPKARSATVLWVGVAEGASALAELAGAVMRATAPLGHPPDDRPYRPHLTVARTFARAARSIDLRPAVAVLDDAPPGPSWTTRELVLVESDTRADGAVHTEITRCPLGTRSE